MLNSSANVTVHTVQYFQCHGSYRTILPMSRFKLYSTANVMVHTVQYCQCHGSYCTVLPMSRFILYTTANVTSDAKLKLPLILHFLQHLCSHFFFIFINHHITKTAIMEGTVCGWLEESNYTQATKCVCPLVTGSQTTLWDVFSVVWHMWLYQKHN
jgi:hypothetical protein